MIRGTWIAAGHAVLGAALVLRPRTVARRAGGAHQPQPPAWLVRVLGGRSVLQAAATALVPGPTVLLAGAAVDATHALSMLPVVIVSDEYRRVAAASGAVALVSAAAAAAAARSAQPQLAADTGERMHP